MVARRLQTGAKYSSDAWGHFAPQGISIMEMNSPILFRFPKQTQEWCRTHTRVARQQQVWAGAIFRYCFGFDYPSGKGVPLLSNFAHSYSNKKHTYVVGSSEGIPGLTHLFF